MQASGTLATFTTEVCQEVERYGCVEFSFQTLRQDAMSKAVWPFDDSSKMDVAVNAISMPVTTKAQRDAEGVESVSGVKHPLGKIFNKVQNSAKILGKC